MKKTKEELVKEERELEILKAVFEADDSDHLSKITFEQYLKRIKKSDLGKQIDGTEEAEKKLTKEQKEEIYQYENEYLASGGKRTFSEWKKALGK